MFSPAPRGNSRLLRRLSHGPHPFGRPPLQVGADLHPQRFGKEVRSLLGPSGCGKSTLLRLIGDLLQPSAGRLSVRGKSAAQARRDRDYGIVF